MNKYDELASSFPKARDIINYLISIWGYQSYLEIGTNSGATLLNIACKDKIGIDPDSNAMASIHKTSNDFFASNTTKFDIIFIDGLHRWYQVLDDIENSIKVLNKNGIILLHDCNPIDLFLARTHQAEMDGYWNGDVYKAVLYYRKYPEYIIRTIDTDWGISTIRFNTEGAPQNLDITDFSFDDFDANRSEYLNLISVEKFLNDELNLAKLAKK